MIPVFVISLPGAVERRKNIQSQLTALGIEFEWFDAVYGKSLSETEIKELCDYEAVQKQPEWLTRGAIGCALSHYYIYKEVIKRGAPYAVVLEDDVRLEADFKRLLQEIPSFVSGNQVISFYYQSWNPLKLYACSKKKLLGKYALFKPKDLRQPITTAGYIITNEACMSLSEVVMPVRRAADSWGDFYQEGGFQEFLCVYPRPIDTTDAKSSIDYIKNEYLSRLLNLIENKRVFPFYTLLKMRRKRNREKMLKVEFVD